MNAKISETIRARMFGLSLQILGLSKTRFLNKIIQIGSFIKIVKLDKSIPPIGLKSENKNILKGITIKICSVQLIPNY